MMHFHSRFWMTLSTMSLSGQGIHATTEDEDTSITSLMDWIQSQPELTTFGSILEQTGMAETLGDMVETTNVEDCLVYVL